MAPNYFDSMNGVAGELFGTRPQVSQRGRCGAGRRDTPPPASLVAARR
jgi:hypothetical protein